ncbi:MAG TPA: hypothetical protein ENJ09_11540 [Planctomycetes bacterium]|nr:hypothetical protein [Planctomycetota bacterium]
MSPREPTREELQAMAYVDGELAPDERAAFEQRLSSDRALALEVAELQRLAVIARQVAPREPIDSEWERLAGDPIQSAGLPLGFLASALGAIGLFLWWLVEILRSDLELLPKVFFALLVFGLLFVFLLVARARARTLPFDPYRDVQR